MKREPQYTKTEALWILGLRKNQHRYINMAINDLGINTESHKDINQKSNKNLRISNHRMAGIKQYISKTNIIRIRNWLISNTKVDMSNCKI